MTIPDETMQALHNRWVGMRQRCENENNPRYARYGGKGVTVCERWQTKQLFIDDMLDKLKPISKDLTIPKGMSMDRIDNNGDYCPENVRWATTMVQNNNQSDNHRLTFNGETLTLAEWGRKTGINQTTLWDRVTFLGWTTEEALTTPVCPGRYIEWKGKQVNFAQLCKEHGVAPNTVKYRLKMGHSLERSLSKEKLPNLGGATGVHTTDKMPFLIIHRKATQRFEVKIRDKNGDLQYYTKTKTREEAVQVAMNSGLLQTEFSDGTKAKA